MMATRPLRIFFSVGEPSGDLHGANLIQTLRQEQAGVEIVGFGGPRMQAAGMTLMADLTQLAVMWIAKAVLNLDKFWKLLREADEFFRTQRPDAVVLIDYPGFNWWIARKAKKHGIPVFYYGAPQLWAWGGWRIGKMRRLVDHVICKLPFEAQWYQERGCQATFVGHPYFDQLSNQRLDREFIHRHGSRQPGRVVTILPGSRTAEVTNNLPWMIKAAGTIARKTSAVRFAIASFNDQQAAMAKEMIAGRDEQFEIHVNRTSELIQLSECCMACSGSVSLELMYYAKPSVIMYWLPRLTYFLGMQVLRVKYMTLVNLLACEDRFRRSEAPYDPGQPGADQVPFPEYPTCGDKSADLAAHVVRWLDDPVEYHQRVVQLLDLKSRFCSTGATDAAAHFILEKLQATSAPTPLSPHRQAA